MADQLPDELIARLRHEVHSLLAVLTPGEAKALRARFGLDKQRDEDLDEEAVRALIRELAALKKKKKS